MLSKSLSTIQKMTCIKLYHSIIRWCHFCLAPLGIYLLNFPKVEIAFWVLRKHFKKLWDRYLNTYKSDIEADKYPQPHWKFLPAQIKSFYITMGCLQSRNCYKVCQIDSFYKNPKRPCLKFLPFKSWVYSAAERLPKGLNILFLGVNGSCQCIHCTILSHS